MNDISVSGISGWEGTPMGEFFLKMPIKDHHGMKPVGGLLRFVPPPCAMILVPN